MLTTKVKLWHIAINIHYYINCVFSLCVGDWDCVCEVCTPAYYAQFFTYYAFEQCSKNLPIMLNDVTAMTTAIMPQFVNGFIIFND